MKNDKYYIEWNEWNNRRNTSKALCKTCPYSELFWSECGVILILIFLHSDLNNFEHGHFSRSEAIAINAIINAVDKDNAETYMGYLER